MSRQDDTVREPSSESEEAMAYRMLTLLEQLAAGATLPSVFVGKWEDPETGKVYDVALPADRIEGILTLLRDRWRQLWLLPVIEPLRDRAERAEAAWWHMSRLGEELRLQLLAAEQGQGQNEGYLLGLRTALDLFTLRSKAAYALLREGPPNLDR